MIAWLSASGGGSARGICAGGGEQSPSLPRRSPAKPANSTSFETANATVRCSIFCIHCMLESEHAACLKRRKMTGSCS
jgi:hypothetical protein